MISHSSAPYDILGEMFELKLSIVTPILLPYQPHSSMCYFCWTLYINSHTDEDTERKPLAQVYAAGECWTEIGTSG